MSARAKTRIYALYANTRMIYIYTMFIIHFITSKIIILVFQIIFKFNEKLNSCAFHYNINSKLFTFVKPTINVNYYTHTYLHTYTSRDTHICSCINNIN